MEINTNINEDIRYQIKLISTISLGMFLFMLFFEPFEYKVVEFNEKLVFVLGIAAISFLILGIFRIILPQSFTKKIKFDSIKISNEVSLILFVWLLISMANISYLVFVGKVELTLAIGVKMVIFSAFPSATLKIADVYMSLQDQLRHFARKNIKLEHDLSLASRIESKALILHSDSQNDNLEIFPDEIMMVKSADNYVEIVYLKDQEVTHKLLRNTLKNIQGELKGHSEFVRCHRSCIVNATYIINLTNSYKGHRLQLIDFNEEVPVSRQYIMNIKEVLNTP